MLVAFVVSMLNYNVIICSVSILLYIYMHTELNTRDITSSLLIELRSIVCDGITRNVSEAINSIMP